MAPLPTPGALINRLRSTYWFLPSLVTLAAAGLAVGLLGVDRTLRADGAALQWVYDGGAEGARALLAAVAGSAMTVVSVTFSVLVVALTVSSQHFGPRLLPSFMRDNGAQVMLGAFTGTFVYCLLVLRTVQGPDGVHDGFVPHLAITVGVGLAFVSVGVLIYFVHHVARSLQVSSIAAAVAGQIEDTIDRLYPDALAEPAGVRMPPPNVPPDAEDVPAPRSGYVQAIDAERLLRAAHDHDLTIWVTARPGTFVVAGTCLARTTGVREPRQAATRHVSSAFAIGADRSAEQDAAFGFQQLTEVALRALSPGLNEPFTAITCIDRLFQGYRRLGTRPAPDAVRVGADGAVRVVALPYTFTDLLTLGLEPIARASGSSPLVVERLLAVLGALADLARTDDARDRIRDVAQVAQQALSRSGEALSAEQRRRLEVAASRVPAQ